MNKPIGKQQFADELQISKPTLLKRIKALLECHSDCPFTWQQWKEQKFISASWKEYLIPRL